MLSDYVTGQYEPSLQVKKRINHYHCLTTSHFYVKYCINPTYPVNLAATMRVRTSKTSMLGVSSKHRGVMENGWVLPVSNSHGIFNITKLPTLRGDLVSQRRSKPANPFFKTIPARIRCGIKHTTDHLR
jgi:hypothetical protein